MNEPKTAVVTGGAGQLGESMSLALVEAGHRVVITYRHNPDLAEKLADRITSSGGQAVALPFDLADDESAQAVLAEAENRFGPVGILVSNGIYWTAVNPTQTMDFATTPDERWRPEMRANAENQLGLVRAALPSMIAQGWGRVIFISTTATRSGIPGGVLYGAAKAAMHGAARSLAWEIGRHGITVNTVLPGLISTERVLANAAAYDVDDWVAHTPLGRLATAEEVAATVAFLASPQASGLTGQELLVDGGRG